MMGEIELTDALGVQDCRAWFDRAIDNTDRAALADWAERYGRSLCELAVDGFDAEREDSQSTKDAVRDALENVADAEAALENIKDALGWIK